MVGDDDQAIYNFRGGSSEYIRSLQQRFEEKGKTVNQILLEQNYRSTKSITNCVNALIQQNQKRLNKKMWTKNEQGSAVHVIACASPEEEADFVAQCILHIKTQGQLTFADFAILFRARYVEPSFAQKFKQLDIPFLTRTSLPLMNRAVVEDVLDYVGLLNEPKNDKAFKCVLNVPARGLGQVVYPTKSDIGLLGTPKHKLIQKAKQQARASIASSSHSTSHFSKRNDVSLYEAAI